MPIRRPTGEKSRLTDEPLQLLGDTRDHRVPTARRGLSRPRGDDTTASLAGRALGDFAGSEVGPGAGELGAGGAAASLAPGLGLWAAATAAGDGRAADEGEDEDDRRAGAEPVPGAEGEAGRGEGFGAGAGTAVEGRPDFDCL